MDKFKIETSIQFPLLKMNELVTYSEVKKPSGIAYILLVLIKESKNKNDLLANVLENFGIPKSLHYIFAGTIQNLIDQEILENPFFHNLYFDACLIGDFKFTNKGKKIFAEESIPTGKNKELKIPVYFNIALNELSLKIDSDLEPKPVMDCAITPEFINKFSCKKSVEDFLNLNKGTKIDLYANGKRKGFGLIKKEEIITSVEELEKENWVCKYDCNMYVYGDRIDIEFDNSLLQSFFDKYYVDDMVNKSISYKKKFEFSRSYAKDLRLTDYDSDRIVGIIIPIEIDDILKQKNQLTISKGNYKNNGYEIIDSNCIDSFDKTIEFIQVDMHDSVYGYIPGIFNFRSKIFEKIEIPLILKIKISKDELKEIVKVYIRESLTKYTIDNFKELVRVTNITGDYDYAEEVINNFLDKDAESNIVILNEMKQFALSNVGILKTYKKFLHNNYYKYLDLINDDNFETTLKISSSIPRFLNINVSEVLDRVFKNIKSKDKIRLYETLVNNGFDNTLVLQYVNPVIDVLKTRNTGEKSLIDLINYDNSLSEMKKITSIIDYKNYLYDEEKIDHISFRNNYNKAFNLQKSIQVFKNSNEELFKDYEGFMNLFSTINDDINLTESALKNPNNLKLELIEKKISSGDYQFVFVNLSAKLESILKNKYKLAGKLSDMLNDAKSKKLIDKKIVADLHDFRDNRNANVHPVDRTPKFDANDLRRWACEIFDLEVEKK